MNIYYRCMHCTNEDIEEKQIYLIRPIPEFEHEQPLPICDKCFAKWERICDDFFQVCL